MNEEALFAEALGKEGEARAAFLDAHCKADVALRRRLDALLRAGDHPDPFLDAPAPGCGVTAEARERPGTTIGAYKLLEQIGEGGFGIVFMAEQTQPVRRKVALKVLKPGMDTRQVVARFEAERQALALMDHANIARVFDGGETASGRPYFVMELVRGIPITDFCDQNHLSVRARLGLFIDVCQAVQHAHQKGIIHRDLKPSNILVTMHDDRAVVKVIDFGIAKATGQQLTEKTLFTNFAQMVGTPLYMSPEQAQMSGLDVDTRSDIYSLGVLLYELLTGTTPFDSERLRTAAYDEIRRIIREEEPARPSTRVSTLGRACPTASANRQSDPQRLSRLFRGELDWIVMKALEKDRGRRYDTANAFAQDVHRYLNDEPVQACPPSAWYRFRKFARHHKAALASGTLIALTVLAATVGLAFSNAYLAREKARKETALAEAEANLLLARQAVDEIYTPVAEQMYLVPHMQPFQRDVMLKARGFYQEFAKRNSSDPSIRLESAYAALFVLEIQLALGERDGLEPGGRAVIASLQQLERELPSEPRYLLAVGRSQAFLGSVLSLAGRGQEAEQAQRGALARYSELAARFPEAPNYQRWLVTAHNTLGSLQHDRPLEAEQSIGKAIRLGEELMARWPDDPLNRGELLHGYFLLGKTLVRLGRLPQAVDAFRKAISMYEQAAPRLDRTGYRSSLPLALHDLGLTLAAQGRTDEAEATHRRAVSLGEKLTVQFPDIPAYRDALASYYLALTTFLGRNGRREEAVTVGRRMLELTERIAAEYGEEKHPKDRSVIALLDLAGNLRDANELRGAELAGRKALGLAKKLAADSPGEASYQVRLAQTYAGLGSVLQRAGKFKEGAAAYREQLAIREKLAAALPADPDYRCLQAKATNFVGVALRLLPEEAATAPSHHRKAIQLVEPLVAKFPDQVRYRKELVRGHYGLALARTLTGHWGDVEAAYEAAITGARPLADPTADPIPQLHNNLAWLLATCPDVKRRDAKRAVELAGKAVELAPKDGNLWNTLGVARYRASDWSGASEALHKRMELCKGGDSFDWFFLAMAHWQRGEKDKAREWYERAEAWRAKNRPKDEELRRFRAEAAELLKVEAVSKGK